MNLNLKEIIKKSQKRKRNNNIKEINNENNNNIEDDFEISEFKKCIEDFTERNNHYLYPKKIEPNLSGSFINKLKMYYE